MRIATNRQRVLASRFALLFALAVMASCGGTEQRGAALGPLAVRDAWARAADSGATGGAYLTLANTDTAAVTITGWTSPAAESTELHETMQHDGMAQMIARNNVGIARDSVFVMKPGGVHVMLVKLNRALMAGDTIRITLTLADGRSVVVTVPVRAP